MFIHIFELSLSSLKTYPNHSIHIRSHQFTYYPHNHIQNSQNPSQKQINPEIEYTQNLSIERDLKVGGSDMKVQLAYKTPIND